MKLSKLLSFLTILALLLVGGTAFADDPPVEEKPAEQEQPAASSGSYSQYAGEWQSDWGNVTLEIQGSHVKGKWKHGTFEGDFNDKGVLFYDWSDEQGNSGKGIFNIDRDGKIIGRWGFGASNNNGGDWTLWR